MTSFLPLLPIFSSFPTPVKPTLLDECDVEHDDLDVRKSDVAGALLGDAILGADDLPDGWERADVRGSKSLFGRSEVGALFIADMRVRFRHAGTGEMLEQHIAVLPRWAVRHFADELDANVTETICYQNDSRSQTTLMQMPEIGDQKFAFRTERDRGLDVAPAGTDAVVLRRGAMLMALAFWQDDGNVPHPSAATSMAVVADRKWSATADALR